MSLIVVVDDSATNRAIYSKLALSIGRDTEVKDFEDPQKALLWLENKRPNLIVTDYDMPQMDGEEFILRFRQLPYAQAVPIIMITVLDQRVLRLRALESGATDFLNSPVDHYEFLMRARNLLDLRQASAQEVCGQEYCSPEACACAKEANAPPAAREKVAKTGSRRRHGRSGDFDARGASGERAIQAPPASAYAPPASAYAPPASAYAPPASAYAPPALGSAPSAPPLRRPVDIAEWEGELQRELPSAGLLAGCALHLIDVESEGAPLDPAAVEAALRGQLRGGDWLRRVGESRFAILQKNVGDPSEVAACAARLRALRALGATYSVGTATSAISGAVPPILHRAALAALARERNARAAPDVLEPSPASAWVVASSEVRSSAGDRLWRFLPQVDLVSGEMCGAQMLEGPASALARDESALRAAFALAQAVPGPTPFRVSLRAPCAADGGAPVALRIATILAESRANPTLLDIEMDGLELIENAARAEMELRALRNLGVHVTLAVAGLAHLDVWTAPDSWLRPALQCCDRIKIECWRYDKAAAARLGQRIAAWCGDPALPVLAAGVAGAELLAPLRRAGARQAQGDCFGAPFSGDDLRRLLAPAAGLTARS